MLRSSLAPLLRRALVASSSSGTTSSSSSSTGSAAAIGGAAAARGPRRSDRPYGATAAAAPKIEAETPAERAIADLIASKLDGAERVAVRDTSGGCGAMYTIEVSAAAFSGLSTVKQHQAVTRALGDEVGKWHGFQLVTSAPK